MTAAPRVPRGPHPEAGFTLIEALVALAIGGLVIATLATVTGQWLRTWSTGFPVLQRSELLVAALDRIVADLSAARLVPAGMGGTGIVFAGDEASVLLVRRTLPVEAPAGLEVIRLEPLSATSDVTLTRRRALLPPGAAAPSGSDPAPVTLLQAPYAIRFAYADDDRLWHPAWTARARLPRAIQVTLIDRRSGRATLPPIAVALPMDAPLACATATSAVLCDAARGLGPPSQTPPAARLSDNGGDR